MTSGAFAQASGLSRKGLRLFGMPLAVIRSVSGLPPAQAAVELAAYWATVEAEIAARRELATFLIGYLSGKDPGKDTAAGHPGAGRRAAERARPRGAPGRRRAARRGPGQPRAGRPFTPDTPC